MKYLLSLSTELQALILQIMISLLAFLAALLTAAVTYYQSKRLTFFTAFFEKKSVAYERFLTAVFTCNPQSSDELGTLASATATVLLYVPSDLYCSVAEYHNLLVSFERLRIHRQEQTIDQAAEILAKMHQMQPQIITLLHEDMVNCTKFKFK